MKTINYKKILISSAVSFLLLFCIFLSLKVINGAEKSKVKKITSSILKQTNKKNKKTNKKSLDKNSQNKKSNKNQINNVKNNKKSIDPLNYDFSKWNEKNKKLVVINKNNSVSNILVEEIEKNLKYCGKKQVYALIYSDLCKMFKEAKKDGIDLWVCSGYRSPKYQQGLFNKQVKKMKNKGFNECEAEKEAEKVVAKPWHSEHNTGLAVDINCADSSFSTSKQYKWLKNNAHRFGFIERYLYGKESITGCIYEPWHWRYVGKENAEEIKNSGLALEEFIIYKMLNLFINPSGK